MEQPVSNVISSILVVLMTVDLVSVAFATMPFLCDAFMHSVVRIIGSDANIPALKKHLQQIYINKISQYASSQLLCEHSLDGNLNTKECINPGCIALNKFVWVNSLTQFITDITVKMNKKYTDFDYVYQNLPDFASMIDTFMNNFAKVNHCDSDSDLFKSEFSELKQWIQKEVLSEIEDFHEDHITFCADDGYAYGAPTFWECPCSMNHIKPTWTNAINEYIFQKNLKFDSVPIDPKNLDFKLTELDEPEQILVFEYPDFKEDLRMDFTKKTKGVLRDKRRHFRNKGIKIK
jgi:hypothetical protein